MTSRIKLRSGGQVVRPSLESDDEYGIAHRLRYSPDSISRGDQLTLAEIVDTYGYLLIGANRAERDRICNEAREAVRNERL